MAYVPKDWVTGEVITEEALDHIENGIVDATGYKESTIVIDDETINAEENQHGGGGIANLSIGTDALNGFVGKPLKVIYDSTEYDLPYHDENGGFWGANDLSDVFVVYPSYDGETPPAIRTQTVGKFAIKILGTNVSVSSGFKSAVLSVAPKALKNVLDGKADGSARTSGSKAEDNSYTLGTDAFSAGTGSTASGYASMALGYIAKATANYAFATGNRTESTGYGSHAEGNGTKASGDYAHAEGNGTKASGNASHAEGWLTTASGNASHAEGYNTTASKVYAHAEGNETKAIEKHAHAEGQKTTASGNNSHAEGQLTTASGENSHAEGYNTTASGNNSHAEGQLTTASGAYAHAEGSYTTASGSNSHAEGQSTKASSANQHVMGKYNVEDANGVYAFIIGNGTVSGDEKNAFAIKWDGTICVWNEGTAVELTPAKLAQLVA